MQEGKEFVRGTYMKRVMTGMEAYRALWLVLRTWSEQKGPEEHDFLEWLVQCMNRNSGCQSEWEEAVQEMIEEREAEGEEYHAYKFPNKEGVLKSCNCCENCKFKEI